MPQALFAETGDFSFFGSPILKSDPLAESIIGAMLLRAGLLSLSLLLASRILGLARESAQAAAFGATGLGDVVVLMLTLPDWVAGLLASGALAYVLLPHWARQTPDAQAATQRRLARSLLLLGAGLGLLLGFGRDPALSILAVGVPQPLRETASEAMIWSALALPLALLAALWSTRLQHLRDFAGMYGANLVVNGVLIGAMLWIAIEHQNTWAFRVFCLFFLLAMGLRLLWQAWRLRRGVVPGDGTDAIRVPASGDGPASPAASVWLWAGLSAGLPLALPFVARSLASQSGEGALATFNYAWKLIELPLVLAIQLVATLAFPAIARALADRTDTGHRSAAADTAIRAAMALAWTLACAAAAGLFLGAPSLAALLFGWGRMDPPALSRVALWGASGAWSLLPQAVTAVGLTVLAVQGKMRLAALAYGAVLTGLLGAGNWAGGDGERLMVMLNLAYVTVAAVVLVALGSAAKRWLPLRLMAATLSGVMLAAWIRHALPAVDTPTGLTLAVTAAFAVVFIGLLSGPDLRHALRR